MEIWEPLPVFDISTAPTTANKWRDRRYSNNPTGTETGELTAANPELLKFPILKYFFAQGTEQGNENEIIFAITPHIVRSQELTDENLRLVDLGGVFIPSFSYRLYEASIRNVRPDLQLPTSLRGLVGTSCLRNGFGLRVCTYG
jgi:hypothetical protein